MANNKSRYTFIEFIQNYSIRIPLIQRDYVQGREYTDEKKLEKRQEFIRLLMDALKDGKVYHSGTFTMAADTDSLKDTFTLKEAAKGAEIVFLIGELQQSVTFSDVALYKRS